MSNTWLVSLLELLLLSLLGQCQHKLSLNAWAKSDALDVFATSPHLAASIDAHTNHENHVNNTTLAAAEELDPLAPPAASLRPLSQRKLSRGKRFVAFPLGSSASVSEHTKHIQQTIHTHHSIKVSA